ncbi:hypothetical protein [Urechidicola croceus]|uniref:Uncharacterized protein n=1 Tax=Urechidicola croceus TaxID=1850246 RepID=A0A1D8P3R2_9FLAO|nr:hypothetical protein [Urechidicola croceus]AOW19204.1 hypothetical protein LPB138_00225 [Urechidicola croceus]
MKLITLYLFLIISSSSVLDEVRNEFPKIESNVEADEFLSKLENEESVTLKAYSAIMLFMKSRYVKFPTAKMKYFNKGKKRLEKLINENPDNIEIRYLRFFMQKQIPKFLGYNKNIEEDFLYIMNNIYSSNLETKIKTQILNKMLLVDDLESVKSEQIKSKISEL